MTLGSSRGRCRRYLFVLLGVSLALPQGAVHAKPRDDKAQPASIAIRILLDKTTYKKGERIQISFELTNRGKEPVYVNKRLYVNPETLPPDDREIVLKLTSPSGTALPYKFSYSIGLPQSDDFELLQPNQTAKGGRQWDLSSFFDLNDVGTYTLSGIYQNVFGKEIGLDVFKGPVEAEPVTITITP